MIKNKGYILMVLLTGLTRLGIAQKQGTLVIEPEITQLMTMVGPVMTNGIYASQLCDSITRIQCNDPSVKITSYDMTIEMSRSLTVRSASDKVPDTICMLSARLRGEELIYIENVMGLDANGKTVKLPPVRVFILTPEKKRSDPYDFDEADPVDPRN